MVLWEQGEVVVLVICSAQAQATGFSEKAWLTLVSQRYEGSRQGGCRAIVYLGSRLGHVAVCFASGYIPDLKVAFRREGSQVDPLLLIGQSASVRSSLEGPIHLQSCFKMFQSVDSRAMQLHEAPCKAMPMCTTNNNPCCIMC